MIDTICCPSLMNGLRRSATARKVLALFFMMVFPIMAEKQHDPLPKAKTLFENYIKKTGGQAAYDQIRNRLTKSVMQMSIPAMSAEVTSQLTRSGPYHVSVDSPMGKIEYGSDGQTVWETNPMSGPRIREGQERLRFLSLYGLDLPARWRQAFKKVICTGKETIDGKSAFRIEAFTRTDFQLTYYFDQTSGLLVKIELPMETMAGKGIQEILLGDYRRVDGILFPHSQVRKEAGREMNITIKSVTHNVEIPANEFALPEAVRKIAGSGQ